MDLPGHFAMLARYNRMANELLYQACSALDDAEYRRSRPGSFGSIHALLNHILLGDRIWMARFAGGGVSTPPLNSILFDNFSALRLARAEEDARIETFFDRLDTSLNTGIDTGFLGKLLPYTDSQGKSRQIHAPVAVSHFFNHQTHHRGQVHVMLSQSSIQPPSLDLHRILQP